VGLYAQISVKCAIVVHILRNLVRRTTMKTRVVNRTIHPYDVYIGRGSKWGNPFIICGGDNRDAVCDKYERWFWKQPELYSSIDELKGKLLGCFCKPLRCHGDFLAHLANEGL
jgi:hypothetical protein